VTRFHGKYRGRVENNVDPLMLGRVQVSVPLVLGSSTLAWAMPCVPYAGSGVGLFLIPPRKANVWVEFEGGHPDRPIWTGCFWGIGEVPVMPAIPQMKVLKTDGVTLTINDLPGVGGLTIEVGPPYTATPLKLRLSSSGIEITNAAASVKLTPASVSLNNGALEVV
jgi:Type VI secretion system/phage-baseplate injector OB domain